MNRQILYKSPVGIASRFGVTVSFPRTTGDISHRPILSVINNSRKSETETESNYLVVENAVVSEIVGHIDLHFRAALGVGVQDCHGRLDKLETVVEEDGAHERKSFELLQRYRAFQQLPLLVAGAELLNELVRVGEEVVLVVLVADLVAVLLDRSRFLVLQVLVQHEVPARRTQQSTTITKVTEARGPNTRYV